RGRQRVDLFMARIDEHLADSKYLAGDFFSIADISAMVFVDFAAWLKIPLPSDAENLKRWYNDVSKRPSTAA
ncbi:MAG: glutathione binding-like protein, partial [Woeseiaceae bacterium]